MSASPSAMDLEARASRDIIAAIKRLYLRRTTWRIAGRVELCLAALVVLLLLVATVDYFFPISWIVRALVVAPVLVAGVAIVAYAVGRLVARKKPVVMARDVEAAARRHDNALVTYVERSQPQHTHPRESYMLTRLRRQAQNVLDSLDEKDVMQRKTFANGAAALAVLAIVVMAFRLFAPTAFAKETSRILRLAHDERIDAASMNGSSGTSGETSAITITNFQIRLVPPAYSGLPTVEAASEGPIRALTGSRIELEMHVTGPGQGVTIDFAGNRSDMRALGDGRYLGEISATTSGAFETRVINEANAPVPAPIVRALEVYPDVPPEIRVNDPASDQVLKEVPSNPIRVLWSAMDDLGLASVKVNYIRSRGEGDAAKFESGTLPVNISDGVNSRDWRGTASLDLSRLGVARGDTLVFWLEAQDRNPSKNNTGRSATLAIAVAMTEPVKLNLVDLGPNEIGRYLLSQRMILIHTEKLHQQGKTLARQEFIRRSNDIAAEQREFKSSFNDFINIEGGGAEESTNPTEAPPATVEEQVRAADEERTGVHDHGIPDPPAGTPSNVRDMIFAIRAMWDAEDALTIGDTTKAIGYERVALARLKSAQAAVRYIPPIVARSKPIDLKRRYAGELADIKTRLERLTRAAPSKETLALRASLADAYAALADLQGTLDVPVTARAGAIGRARDKTREAADKLSGIGGDHAATIAEALGQLRIVETQLAGMDTGGTADEYAARISKSLALLTQASGNLYAVADQSTRATGGEPNTTMPAQDRRAADYFRRLK